jgi:Toprim-like
VAVDASGERGDGGDGGDPLVEVAVDGLAGEPCDEIIVCESLIDALTFWCAGFRHVTASYGAGGFTADHQRAFAGHGVRRVLIAYDRDDAGDKAAGELTADLTADGRRRRNRGKRRWRRWPRVVMPNEIARVRVTATRWVSDEPIPGVVEVLLEDADGKVWKFVDKAPMFDDAFLLFRDSVYPVGFEIACTILGRRIRDGLQVVEISTARPWGLEAIDGTSQFEVEATRVRDID